MSPHWLHCVCLRVPRGSAQVATHPVCEAARLTLPIHANVSWFQPGTQPRILLAKHHVDASTLTGDMLSTLLCCCLNDLAASYAFKKSFRLSLSVMNNFTITLSWGRAILASLCFAAACMIWLHHMLSKTAFDYHYPS